MKIKERDAYRLPVHRELVDVTREVYVGFYQEKRKAKTVDEKNQRNGLLSYDALDTESTLGEEAFQDSSMPSLEEVAEETLLRERLHHCLGQLPEEERRLVESLYFEGLTERQCAKNLGISQKAVNKRRHKILAQLKKLLEN